VENNKEKIVAVFDVDGTLTDNGIYYTEKGKKIKKFGVDDWDALRELQKHIDIHFVTADKKGWEISYKRIIEDFGGKLDLVSNNPPDVRWKWIKENYYDYKISYVADGIYDWYCLDKANFSVTTRNALYHVRARANDIIDRDGGDRFVAEACISISSHFKLPINWFNVGM